MTFCLNLNKSSICEDNSIILQNSSVNLLNNLDLLGKRLNSFIIADEQLDIYSYY